MKVKCLSLLLAGLIFSSCEKGIQNSNDPASLQSTTKTKSDISIAAVGVTLNADGPGSTYSLLNSVLGGTAYEVPDCGHAQNHISEVFDSALNTNVFVFSAHVALDDDRCEASDRQRTEIKTYGPSPANLKATNGETVTYRWKFKIDAGFKASSSFTHLHQIKAGDGDAGSPLITITPRYGANNTDKMELIHINSSGTTTKVKIVNLAPFKGNWVDVVETIKFGSTGTYSITINKVSDGTSLMSYSNSNMDLWRSATTFCRPKWGIYRSLNNSSQLRDEEVRFANFCIAEGSATCP
ncbi:heparin lyase I family protein [Pedobacter gandavensis]|uniref:heparin lyase I family protein n=1 Tax=Pedobacter gandavensis TaxID=2679963 RepID=UPI002930E012|nr:heparin lyase I family protein [Pedobacter gandavensis]